MDQTSFSLLCGLLIGFPVAFAVLRQFLSFWISGTLAVPVGILPFALLVYWLVGKTGKPSDSATKKSSNA